MKNTSAIFSYCYSMNGQGSEEIAKHLIRISIWIPPMIKQHTVNFLDISVEDVQNVAVLSRQITCSAATYEREPFDISTLWCICTWEKLSYCDRDCDSFVRFNLCDIILWSLPSRICHSHLSLLISYWVHEKNLMSAFRWLAQKKWDRYLLSLE